MYKISNFSDNDDVKIIDKSGSFEVIEYQRDLSVMPEDAQLAFFCSQINVRKRQLKCELSRGHPHHGHHGRQCRRREGHGRSGVRSPCN